MSEYDVPPADPKLNAAWVDGAGVLRYWDGERWELYVDIPGTPYAANG